MCTHTHTKTLHTCRRFWTFPLESQNGEDQWKIPVSTEEFTHSHSCIWNGVKQNSARYCNGQTWLACSADLQNPSPGQQGGSRPYYKERVGPSPVKMRLLVPRPGDAHCLANFQGAVLSKAAWYTKAELAISIKHFYTFSFFFYHSMLLWIILIQSGLFSIICWCIALLQNKIPSGLRDQNFLKMNSEEQEAICSEGDCEEMAKFIPSESPEL
jgi:hypothetical protein